MDSRTGAGVDLRQAGDCWSPASPGPSSRGWRPLVAGRGSTPGLVRLFSFFLNFFFFLPSTFCASGQFLLIGSSTCPPYPDFSLKLQTPITFDP
jgi:hypothetical protein